jgi:hypothetical protein
VTAPTTSDTGARLVSANVGSDQQLRRPPSLYFVVALVAAEAVWLSFLGFVIFGLIR